MIYKSVGSRLLVIVLSIVIVGMGLVVAIGGILAGTAIHEQTLGRISEGSFRYADRISIWITEQTGTLEAIAITLSSLPDIESDTVLPVLKAISNNNPSIASVYMGFSDGKGIFSDDWEPDYNEWRANERDWYKGAVANPDHFYITEMYQDATSGDFCITFSMAFKRNGAVAGVLAIDILTNELSEVILVSDVGEDSYAFLTDQYGQIMVHSNDAFLPTLDENEDTIFQNLAEIENGHYAVLTTNEVIEGDIVSLKSADGKNRYYSANRIDIPNWVFYTTIPKAVVDAPLVNQIVTSIIIFVIVVIATIFLINLSIRKMIVKPVEDVTEAANRLSRGENVASLNGEYIGEIALLADSFRGMEDFNRQQTEWMEKIANGNLAVEVRPRSESDGIGQAIVSMLCNLNTLFSDINVSSSQVSAGSKQIADGANSLAQGTTEQAAAIEELSETVERIDDNTKRNAEIANGAAMLSGTIRTNAEKGSSQMNQLMDAVREINEASNSIRNVIKTIDDIAFQTNILALNAAVEAARAGAHGKGFAVVADEVRDLAAKSAEAAKNTEDLIVNSIEKANLGLNIATETSESLTIIVDDILKSSELANQLAMASEKQTDAIDQLNRGLDQVSMVVQQNSATAEQSAAASAEMSNQSARLEMLISFFKLNDLN